jgi:hypothetical protein
VLGDGLVVLQVLVMLTIVLAIGGMMWVTALFVVAARIIWHIFR